MALNSHYKRISPEPKDVIRGWLTHQEYSAWCRANVVKYVARYKEKNGVDDLIKARTYLEEMIENEYGQVDSVREEQA